MANKVCLNNTAINFLRRRLKSLERSAFLLTGDSDKRYLLSWHSGGMLLVSSHGRPVYFTDSMNRGFVESRYPIKDIDIVSSNLPRAVAFSDHVKKNGIKKVFFDESKISVGDFREISKRLGSIPLVGVREHARAGGVMEKMRLIKSPQEISFLRKAAKETVKLWSRLKKEISPGMTELEVSGLLDIMIREQGYENSFPTIAAAGSNSAYPHFEPTNRKLKRGEHLLIDFGIRVKGYSSDLTRIWAEGRINRQIGDFHKYVREAQDKAIKSVKPGVSIGSVVKRVNDLFNGKNVGSYVLHSLGHGIGLDVHERPFLRSGSSERFRKGMVFTIEPGLYLPKLGGVRLEDMVLVTEKGNEVLTR